MVGHVDLVSLVGMITVALTGGIGAGKSTVGRLLAEHGAVVVSSDDLARAVVAPGTPGLSAVVARFGPEILLPDGSLDRAGLARQVFADPSKRADLEAITHPLIRSLTEQHRRAAEAGGVQVWVQEIPLLVEAKRHDAYDVVVVVEASEAVRLARLIERGLTEADARMRMAQQASDEQRRAIADVVIDNSGDEAALRPQVEHLWVDLTRRASERG